MIIKLTGIEKLLGDTATATFSILLFLLKDLKPSGLNEKSLYLFLLKLGEGLHPFKEEGSYKAA